MPKTVIAYCPTCKCAQFHVITCSGPKCKACLAQSDYCPNCHSTHRASFIGTAGTTCLDCHYDERRSR